MAKFEANSLLSVLSGHWRKPASVETEEIVELVLEEATMETAQSTYSIRVVARRIDVPEIR